MAVLFIVSDGEGTASYATGLWNEEKLPILVSGDAIQRSY